MMPPLEGERRESYWGEVEGERREGYCVLPCVKHITVIVRGSGQGAKKSIP